MGSPVYLFGKPGGAQAQPQGSLIETLLGRFLAGQQIAGTIQQANQEASARKQALEQGKLQLEMLKHQVNAAKIQEQFGPIETQFKIAQLLQGQPAPEVSAGGQMPDLANALMGGGMAQSAPMSGVRPPLSIDLSSVMPGAGKVDIPIESQQDQFQRTLAQRYQTGRVEAGAAGMKAGAEAGAKAPFEQALEKLKADTARGNMEYTQGQENARQDKTIRKDLTVAELNRAATREQRTFDQNNKLSDDFRTDTKEFGILDDAFSKIKAGAELQTGAGDVALLYGYMKILDPNSAVREGEVATAKNTSGIQDRVLAAYNRAVAGEALAPAARANFVQAAKKTYESVQPRLKMIEGRYQDKAKKAGLDPKQFTFQGQGTGGPGGGVPEGTIVYDPQGKAHRIVNGQPVPVQ